MFSITTIITALLAAGAPLVASAPVATENKLEARQNPTVVRLFRHRNHNGNDYSDMGIEAAGQCQSLPTSIIKGVSSFKLGVWKCRFFEGANCSGHSQWFDSD
ncbi:hypothetical protein CBER1_07888 [Cercospora berteroae]|uniref:Uncharacterized protein n=1 Tax=Cercospora berteroae TaxID=357750 RepID=A0A2S6BV01_9PEZI|nr:hypothetical protein CBER1_07888 [Cercospora berteroae]